MHDTLCIYTCLFVFLWFVISCWIFSEPEDEDLFELYKLAITSDEQ